jgi:DNA-binding LacI/PurR family transcriptional regulator
MTDIYDVAKRAGVSITTVSHVFSKQRPVATETVARVLEAAKELNYVPNRAAQGLATGRKMTIGLHFPFQGASLISNPYFPELLEGLSAAAARFGYGFLLLPSDSEQAGIGLHELLERIDGGVVIDPTSDCPIIDALLESDLPIVTTGRYLGGAPLPWVDNQHGQQIAHLFEHLDEQGYHRPVLLSTESDFSFYVDTETAFVEEATTRRITPWMVRSKGVQEEQDYASVCQILEHDPLPDAVLALTDYQAAIVLRLANEFGVRVPEQMGVVGFGDTVLARNTHPSLTSVCVNPRLIGNAAIDVLLDLLNDNEPVENRYVASRLVVRRSSTRNAQ